jgi:ABC-2 type transport system permease protein
MVTIRKALAFFKRDLANAMSYKLSYVLQFAGIFFSTTTLFFLSGLFKKNPVTGLESYGGQYFPFVLIGIAFSDYLMTALHSFSSTVREGQLTGTLEPLLLTRTGLPVIMLSTSIYPFILTSLRVLVYMGLGAVVFGVRFGVGSVLGAFIILMLTVISFSSIGIISASFVMVFKKGDPFGWAFGSLSALLGGVLYPVSVLPTWLQKVARLLPLTYALRGMRRTLLVSGSVGEVLSDIRALLLFAFILLPISLMTFRFSVEKAKVDGTLAHY